MPPVILQMVLRNLPLVGILVLIAVLSATCWVRGSERDAARADLAAARVQVSALGAQLAEVNAATERLQAESDQRIAAAREGLAKARSEASQYQGTISQLEARTRSPDAPADCGAALRVVREGLRP